MDTTRQRPQQRPWERPATGARSSNEFGKERDNKAVAFLAVHPCTAEQLVRAGIYPNVKVARKRLRKLKQRGKVREIGLVELRPGRTEKLFACWHVHYDARQHEGEISNLLFVTHADWVRRGWEVDDLKNDAMFGIGNVLCRLERDKNTCSYSQLNDRIKLHAYYFAAQKAKMKQEADKEFRETGTIIDVDNNEYLLWVCDTQARIDGIKRRCEAIAEIVLFTTYRVYIEKGPHAKIWTDYDGTPVALPQGLPHPPA